ncbi:MAG: (d)CMP kinase [Anaerolineae bacterium]
MRPSTIAIDGPAASGKSTIGHHLAQHLDYLFLDTGVLYRAVTWAALARDVPIEDEAQVTKLAQEVDIRVESPTQDDGRQSTVRVGGRDVTWEIRSPEVDAEVSPVSAYPGVREALTHRMRAIAAKGGVVMVGRDIGTVVIPDADLKLYVVASAAERARRRYLDRRAEGEKESFEEVLAGIRRRDRIDSQRATAPLRPAADAVLFDTTRLSIERMFSAVERLVEDCTLVSSDVIPDCSVDEVARGGV